MTAITSDVTGQPRRILRRPVTLTLWAVAAAVLAGWLTLSALHLTDDYRVEHLQGVWLAVTDAARNGQLYPPIFDGEHFAGTRYMPLPILLNAFASRIAGDPLIGGKAVAIVLMATLLAIVVFVLRRVSCPWPIALGLAAAVVATDTGLQAGTTIGGDLLPAVLQTAALAVTLSGRNRSSMGVAGLLAGLAVASKLTGVWSWLAITTWLIVKRQHRSAGIFALACAGTAALTLGTVQVLTSGGLFEHLMAFTFAGVHGAGSLLRGPNQVLYNLLGHAYGTVVLFPLAVVGALLSRGRQVSPIHISLGWALLLLMVVYTDVGTGANQLLDVVVLTALAAGHLAGRGAADADARPAPMIVLAVAVSTIWAAGLDLVRTVAFDLRKAPARQANGALASRPAVVIAGLVKAEDTVLAEDPAIYVALHRQPLVMDPFMMLRLERTHPQWIDSLIARIEERQFDLVVLIVPLEDHAFDYWWTDFHFGPRVAAALRRAYRADGTIGRYFLYRPRQ